MLRNLPLSVLALFVAAAGCARHTIPPVMLINQTRIGPAQDLGPGITMMRYNGITFELVAPAHVIVLRVTNASGIEPVRPLRSGDRSALGRGEHVVTLASVTSARVPGGRSTYGAEAYAGYLACTPAFEGDPIRAPAPSAASDSAGRLARSAVTAQRRYEDCVRRESTRETIFQRMGPTSVTRLPPDDVGYWLLIVSDAPTTAGDLYQRLAPMTFPDSTLLEVVRHLPEALVGSRTTHWAAYYVAFGVPSTP